MKKKRTYKYARDQAQKKVQATLSKNWGWQDWD